MQNFNGQDKTRQYKTNQKGLLSVELNMKKIQNEICKYVIIQSAVKRQLLSDFQRPKGEVECDFENINAQTYFILILILSSAEQRYDVFTEVDKRIKYKKIISNPLTLSFWPLIGSAKPTLVLWYCMVSYT